METLSGLAAFLNNLDRQECLSYIKLKRRRSQAPAFLR
jgi:hypothetical protein